MKIVSTNDARRTEVTYKGGKSNIINFFGGLAMMQEGPQAYLAELPEAGARIEPHFHDVDQFQMVIAGEGNIAREKVAPGTFHFADAFMPYGPIVAKDDGFAFYTLRLGAAGGTFAIPAERRLIQGNPKRNIAGRFELGKVRTMGSQFALERLIESHNDGLEVYGLRLSPNARHEGVASVGGGQFCVVCTGSLIDGGTEAPECSVGFVEPGEPAPQFTAGPEGAEVLILQFPRPSDRPGSDPRMLAGRAGTVFRSPGGSVKVTG